MHDMNVVEKTEYAVGCMATGYPISNRNSSRAHAKHHIRIAMIFPDPLVPLECSLLQVLFLADLTACTDKYTADIIIIIWHFISAGCVIYINILLSLTLSCPYQGRFMIKVIVYWCCIGVLHDRHFSFNPQ